MSRNLCFGLLLGVAAGAAAAQRVPAGPVVLLSSAAPGSPDDARVKRLAGAVGTALRTVFAVETTTRAVARVAGAAADGRTLAVGDTGPLAGEPALQPAAAGAAREVVPVVLIARTPLVLLTRSDKPYLTAPDVVGAARVQPGVLGIGHAGKGGAGHLAAVLWQHATGIEVLHASYDTAAAAMGALLSGGADLMFEPLATALPVVHDGRARALAVTSAERVAALPHVPTMRELGYPQVTVWQWLGVVAPPGTAAAAVRALGDAFTRALADEDGPATAATVGGTPEAFEAVIAADAQRWASLVASGAAGRD